MVVRDLSMAPAFLPGDRLLVDPRAVRGRMPPRGAVVVLHDPEDRRRLLLKRVAARAGEPVPVAGPPGDETSVPSGQVYLLSDRPDAGRDSRRFGPVSVSSLVGRVWFRYHPAERRGPLA